MSSVTDTVEEYFAAQTRSARAYQAVVDASETYGNAKKQKESLHKTLAMVLKEHNISHNDIIKVKDEYYKVSMPNAEYVTLSVVTVQSFQ